MRARGERPDLQILPLGAVRPAGWLLEQLRRDLDSGFAGRLDALTPHASHDLFAERLADSGGSWWDAETRGSWLWGYVLTAHLAGEEAHVRRVEGLLDALADTRDEGGYLGIYAPACRFRHPDGENAELWAQSRALLPLLASWELTGRADRLRVVEDAVALTAEAYGPGRPYFRAGAARGRSAITGLTHGLCYADVLEWLHRAGGAPGHAAFAGRLYDGFSAMPVPFPDDDLALPNLLDGRRSLSGHAVHVAEHLRALLFAWWASGRDDLGRAVEVALGRVRAATLPSGALPGDEGVHGTPVPDAGYETCTSTELLLSLASALEKTGEAALGDAVESLAFNAFSGARLPDGSAVAYLSADTRLAAVAARPDAYSAPRPGRRFKLSPTHDDVACCCAPNSVRLLPHLVSRLWMGLRGEPGLVAAAFGPCSVAVRLGGAEVRVDQDRPYPFADDLRFTVRLGAPARFALWLRRPSWSPRVHVEAPGAAVEEWPGWCRLTREWRDGDAVRVRFEAPARGVRYATGEAAVCRGALQFVLPVRPGFRRTRTYPGTGLADLEVTPADGRDLGRLPVLDGAAEDLGLRPVRLGPEDALRPWDEPPLGLRAGDLTLVPMGSAVLRRAAFPVWP